MNAASAPCQTMMPSPCGAAGIGMALLASKSKKQQLI